MLGPGKTMADAVFKPESRLSDHLFRNDLTVAPDGTRTLRFTDVTQASGIDVRTYGMGVAAADFDNDGFVDLYRTGLSGAVLLRNNGNGTFADVTAKAGVGNPRRLGRVGGVRGLRPRRLAGPVRRQLPAVHASRPTSTAWRRPGSTTTARPTAIAPSPAGSIATAATARSWT